MLPLDSAWLKGVEMTFHKVLIVLSSGTGDGEWSIGEFLSGEIWNVFAYSARTDSYRVKRKAQLDSARQIGLGSTSHDFSDCSGDV